MAEMKIKMVQVTVANGHTLLTAHPTQTQVVTRERNGNTVYITVPADQHNGPGSIVEIPESDVAWLRTRGTVLQEGEVFLPREAHGGGLKQGQPGYLGGQSTTARQG